MGEAIGDHGCDCLGLQGRWITVPKGVSGGLREVEVATAISKEIRRRLTESGEKINRDGKLHTGVAGVFHVCTEKTAKITNLIGTWEVIQCGALYANLPWGPDAGWVLGAFAVVAGWGWVLRLGCCCGGLVVFWELGLCPVLGGLGCSCLSFCSAVLGVPAAPVLEGVSFSFLKHDLACVLCEELVICCCSWGERPGGVFISDVRSLNGLGVAVVAFNVAGFYFLQLGMACVQLGYACLELFLQLRALGAGGEV
ncbi:hypothetical protein U1Q18_026404 [Sarracenia purpurea var. burkii]